MRRNLRTMFGVGVVVVGLLVAAQTIPASAAAPAHPAPSVKAARVKPVPGKAQGSAIKSVRALPAAVPHPSALPGSSTHSLGAGSGGRWQSVDGSGLAVAAASGSGPVSVRVLSPAQAAAHGLAGVVLQVSATGTARRAVSVSVPTALLNGLYGADYASRVRWMQVPDCASRCPAARALSSKTVAISGPSLLPAVPGGQLGAARATSSGAVVASTNVTSTPMLLAASAGTVAANGTGDASAPAVSPSAQWQASPQTGAFTWSDPLSVPPAAAGPSPTLAVSYDSTEVMGHTGSTNNQPSVVGEGFDVSGGGYITRSYVPCSTAGIANSGDECFKTDNASLVLGGHSSELVESAAGAWRLAGDDNSKVEHLSSATLCSNGTYDSDCWRVTTSDGTVYYFGRNKLPGWTSATQSTNSAWTVPVCGTAATRCSGTASTATPFNVQAWRWNLDYVVDVHGNSEAFYYTPQTNRYAEKSSTTASVSYTRGGYLSRIDYGMHAGYEITSKAPDQVTFTYAARCESGVSGEPAGACTTTPPTSANAVYWPDVPWDQNCTTTACSGKDSPTFWADKELATIQTQYLSGSSYLPVDKWTLAFSWPSPGDGSSAALTLSSITHTGLDGGTLALPATKFGYAMKPNRVAPPTGVVPLEKARLVTIDTEAGAHVTINYLATDCSGSSPATPQSNTKRCFPTYWTPPGMPLTLDWFTIYPVASIIADPVTGGPSDTVQQTSYDYSIGAPAWRYDMSPFTPDGQRTWSVFAGFSKVRVEQGDPTSPSTLQTSYYTYFQGMDNDLADTAAGRRSVTLTSSDGHTTVTDSLWWAGRTFETITHNGLGGPVVSDTVATPYASAPTLTGSTVTEHVGNSSTTFGYTPTARYTGDAKSVTTSPLSIPAGAVRTTETDTSYDSLGRPVKVDDHGDLSDPAQEQCTLTSYVDNSTAWIYDAPDELNSYAGSCAAGPADPATDTISDVRTSYDQHAWAAAPTLGDATVTQRATSYTGSTPVFTTASSTSYDALGRPLSTSDAMSRSSTTTYTPAAPAAGGTITGDIGPVTQVRTTDPETFSSTDTLDPGRGVVTANLDANSHLTTTTYDPLGRAIGQWLPDRPKAGNPIPSVGYAYTFTAGHPVAVDTTTLTPTGGTQSSYRLYDGLLRPRQTQAPAEAATYNAAPGTGGSTVTDTLYDAAGQAVTSYQPYAISAAPSATLFVPTYSYDIPGATQTVYDGAGRVTASITDQYGTELWRTSTAYPGVDRVDVTPPSGGTPTTTYTDARGNTARLLQWHGTSIGDPTVPSTFDQTSYTYYPSGGMHTMTNQAGNQWSWSYDLLGNPLTATDPDTGATHSTYDADSELQSSTDQAGTTLWYSYDPDGRKTAVNQDSVTGPLLDSWEYDQLPGGKGLLDSDSSYLGSTAGTGGLPGTPGTAYTNSVTGYDADGRPTGSIVTLPADTFGAGSAAYSYSTSLTYNPDGSLATQADPAAGGLPAETLHNTYTSLGRLYSLIGRNQYVEAASYDQVGDLTSVNRYNGENRLEDAYTYQAGTDRLTGDLTTTAATSGNIAADHAYSYDNAGNLTEDANTHSAGPADTQCYRYDDLQRLQQAWTPASADCAADPSSSALGGPARYWQAYGYDSSGDRTSLTNYATSPGGTDQQDSYSYPSDPGAARPNAVTAISHATAPAGTGTWSTTGTDSYGYNPDGQTTSTPAGTLTWTPQGQLGSLTTSAGTQNRIYDADGNLLLQTDPVTGTVAYLGDTVLTQAPGSSSITGQRTYTAAGQAVAVRSTPNGSLTGMTLNWLSTNPQNTAEVSENTVTAAVTTRLFDPFGNPRGAPVTWPDQRGFLNAPTDPFTSYTHLGARDYSPAIGRFLSVDPVLNPADPQSVNGYAYADNNPVTNEDPSGAACENGPDGSCHLASGRNLATPGASDRQGGSSDSHEGLERSSDLSSSRGGTGRATASDGGNDDGLPSDGSGDSAPRWKYPKNSGFAEQPVKRVIKPGTQLMRYGKEGGRYFTDLGTSPDEVSIPPDSAAGPRSIYVVVKPLEVDSGTAAPWTFRYDGRAYPNRGGGNQYRTNEDAAQLRARGVIRRISYAPGETWQPPGEGQTTQPGSTDDVPGSSVPPGEGGGPSRSGESGGGGGGGLSDIGGAGREEVL
ncbi:MAG: glycohydrolase toxin TNT-related protein [Jatrophihabitantaceae bacterium]